MADAGQCRGGTRPRSVNHDAPIYALDDIRALATADPALLPAASDWAKIWHPRTTLARAA
jgi:hypothetical protein